MIETEEFGEDWQTEEIDEELSEEPESSAISKSRRSFAWMQALAFLLGLALLVYVINRVGIQPLFDALLRIGFGFLRKPFGKRRSRPSAAFRLSGKRS